MLNSVPLGNICAGSVQLWKYTPLIRPLGLFLTVTELIDSVLALIQHRQLTSPHCSGLAGLVETTVMRKRACVEAVMSKTESGLLCF